MIFDTGGKRLNNYLIFLSEKLSTFSKTFELSKETLVHNGTEFLLKGVSDWNQANSNYYTSLLIGHFIMASYFIFIFVNGHRMNRTFIFLFKHCFSNFILMRSKFVYKLAEIGYLSAHRWHKNVSPFCQGLKQFQICISRLALSNEEHFDKYAVFN